MEELQWPPIEDDLRRMYCDQKLSAAKIARAYGLKYPNPKSGETLVLYYLKKFGIARRDRADHIRKVTEEMVNEWVRRYQSGESLKQIAGNKIDVTTVWNHLTKRGIRLRDKIQAQIEAVSKYDRRPLSGNSLEKSYLMGLRYGDMHVVRHGRAVRVRVSTTHPAMANLFECLFSQYGHVSKYPRTASLVPYEWSLECDLDNSFEFLLLKLRKAEMEALTSDEFADFLAGLFDAEGSVHLHRKRSRYNPEASVTNGDAELLDFLTGRLRKLGYHATVRWINQATDRQGVTGPSLIGRLEVLRFLEAQRLLRMLPIRHSEKIAKRELALELQYGSSTSELLEVVGKWKALSDAIHCETRGFVENAKERIDQVRERKLNHLSHD